MTALPPSVYISRLRRAFFLRVHPDRFRSHDPSVRRQQAKLVQALNDRMSWPDFISYNYGSSNSHSNASARRNEIQELHYVLEHRDGSLLRQSLQINDSVENILHSLSEALRKSGAASLPPPPKLQPKATTVAANSSTTEGNIHFYEGNQTCNSSGSTIDHRFDINTTKGRDLLAFCETLCQKQVNERQESRMDARAAAMMGRELFGFQSIDGISLHWSSRSFAILLQSLIALHEEHHTKFHVDSFYPLRLVFTNNEYSLKESLDLYGGVLYLHPGYTPLQWLDIIREVTVGSLATLRANRGALEHAQRKIQSVLGIKLNKGFTCSSDDFFHFVIQLAYHLRLPSEEESCLPVTTTSAIALESIQVTVEDAAACRFRTIITPEGHIRVGCGMSVDKIISSVHRDSEPARKRRDQERKERAISDQHAKQVQYELGLTRKVYKAGTFRVGHNEFQSCLRRIVDLEPEQKSHLRVSLGGNALGVAGSGQFCQLGDSGEVIIPHDWAIKSEEKTATSGIFS